MAVSDHGNGLRLQKATTYISLSLTILLVGLAFRYGSETARQSEQLRQVPTRDEVKLIVIDAVDPLKEEINALKLQLSLIKADLEKRDGG